MCWLVFLQLFAPGSLVLLPTLVTVVAAIVTVAATALAVVLIQLLTTAALNRVREPAVVTYAAKPFPFSLPLFIVGLLVRLATPVVVMMALSSLPG